jgi:flagellar biosynthesis anti-sigma factor FlgM
MMGIEGITNAQIIQRLKNVDSSSQVADKGATASSSDEVNISNDAKLAQTLNRSMKAIDRAPDVREDKVAEVKQNLESGLYQSDEVMDEVAERATQDLLGF